MRHRLPEEQVTDEVLLQAVCEVYENRETYIHAMSQNGQIDSIETILNLIKENTKQK